MPNWVTRAALGAGLGLASIGCNATCIRDSDCLGDSICTENRCLLIVRGDAGNAPSSPPDDSSIDSSGSRDASAPQRDAGD